MIEICSTDFLRAEARKLDLDTREFSLRTTVDRVISLIGVVAREKGLNLAARVHAASPDRVLGDPDRLRQIIVSIVGNAVKFTDEGEVALEVYTESRAADQVRLHFTLRDAGVGIPPERQSDVFEGLAQADASSLGLATSSQLVRMMGGSIWVESETDAGATLHFTVVLGLRADAVGESPKVPPPPPGGPRRPLHILVAEDSPVIQHLARQLIKKRGHTCVIVGAGQEALDALDAEPFDLVLMDVRMPGMDGIEATRTIREREKVSGSHIPIVAMTALSMEADRQRCFEAGLDAFVTKPLRVEELFDVIEGLAGPASGPPR